MAQYTSDRIILQAKAFNKFDEIIAYGPKDFDETFKNTHNTFILNNSRGYGYWIWKSYFVKKTFDILRDNDILIYCDAGCQINNQCSDVFNEYINKVNTSEFGNLSFQMEHIEERWTKKDLFHALDINDEKHHKSGQLHATFFIMRKCPISITIINLWYEFTQNYHLIDNSPSIIPNVPDFEEHRNDQSILSLLRKKYGTVILNDISNTDLNDPFWGMRYKH